jgi:hypothetical protein
MRMSASIAKHPIRAVQSCRNAAHHRSPYSLDKFIVTHSRDVHKVEDPDDTPSVSIHFAAQQ